MNSFFKYTFILLIFTSCQKNYPGIEPGAMMTGEVNFSKSPAHIKSGKFIFSVPSNYNPKTAWPLVITLHGYGSNAPAFHDLWKPVTDSLGFVLLTPQGDIEIEQLFGWTWGDNAERLILTCFDLIRKEVHIDQHRVYLTGFSAGGRLTYRLGFKYQYIFRGIAPLSSPFDESLVDNPKIPEYRLKVYIGYGALENEIKRNAIHATSYLQSLGLNVKSVCYDEIGHGLPEPVTKELVNILTFLDGDK